MNALNRKFSAGEEVNTVNASYRLIRPAADGADLWLSEVLAVTPAGSGWVRKGEFIIVSEHNII